MPYQGDWLRELGMFKNGPEYHSGWRTRRADEGSVVEVIARHNSQKRMPNGSEMSRMLSRGQPLGLVDRVSYEWQVLRDGRQVGALRENSNGTFSLGSLYTSRPREGLEMAAIGAARRVLGAPRPLPSTLGDVDSSEEEPPTPGPR